MTESTETAPLTVYWRPGCGFRHLLRHELDRAGIERIEVNIWRDREAAALVRSHARGYETVPTVVIGNQALVNPSADEVIAALGPDGLDPGADPELAPGPDVAAVLHGIVWSLAAAVVWLGLGLTNPATTYHLAPVVTLLAWPVAARTHRVGWPMALLPTVSGTVLASAAAATLSARDALSGPSLIGSSAGIETGLLIALAALVALWLARPRHRRVTR